METSFCYCPLDAYEGQRTHRYSKGQTDDDSLNKQTDIHAAPETVKNDGYRTLGRGGTVHVPHIFRTSSGSRHEIFSILPVDCSLSSMFHNCHAVILIIGCQEG